jgi:Fe2+ transport system protein FeoA
VTNRPPNQAVPGAQCVKSALCPLNTVRAGTVVCIKQLSASAEMSGRLREMGFREEQLIKLLSCEGNLICLVCNARLGISSELAETILVTPVSSRLQAA